MRSTPSDYAWFAPATLTEATAKLAAEPDAWRPIAGGTDIMVLFEAGRLADRQLLNLWSLSELRGIRVDPGYLEVGALTTYAELQTHPLVREEFPNLAQAAAATGSIAIQNRGTLGGNIANASPAADTPPALLAYAAEIELVSTRGARWIAYDGFHTGYKQTMLLRDELIRAVRLPRGDAAARHWYRKVGTRRAQAIAKVVVAACARWAEPSDDRRLAELRLAMGSVAATPVRLKTVEALLTMRPMDAALVTAARDAVAQDIKPIDDLRSSAGYRLEVAKNLVCQLLDEIAATGASHR